MNIGKLVEKIKNIDKRVIAATGIVTAGIVISGYFLNEEIDDHREGINIFNSVPVIVKNDRSPKDYFELLYRVSPTSDNYNLWKGNFDRLNKDNKNPKEIVIPVLKQIYENNGYPARSDSLRKLMIRPYRW